MTCFVAKAIPIHNIDCKCHKEIERVSYVIKSSQTTVNRFYLIYNIYNNIIVMMNLNQKLHLRCKNTMAKNLAKRLLRTCETEMGMQPRTHTFDRIKTAWSSLSFLHLCVMHLS